MDSTTHRLLLMVLRCKNTTDRAALCYGTLRRADTLDLQTAMEAAVVSGLLSLGTTNASARAWSRGSSDNLLYLTKAGRAALRAMGPDFGSGKLMAATLAKAKGMVEEAETEARWTALLSR